MANGPLGTDAGVITQGQRRATDIAAKRKVPQFTKTTVNVNYNVAPLYGLLRSTGRKVVVEGSQFFALQTDYNPNFMTLYAQVASGDGTVKVTLGHGKRLNVNQILKYLPSGELVRVLGITLGAGGGLYDELAVERGIGGITAAAAMTSGDNLNIFGMADSDGNVAPSGISSEPTPISGYTQIFKMAWELSGRDLNTAVYGEDELKRVKTMTAESLMQQIETSFLFCNGIRAPDATQGGMNAGIEYWIQTNRHVVVGNLAEDTLNAWVRAWMVRNWKQKNCKIIHGDSFAAALDGFGLDKIRYNPADETIGIRVASYRTSFGEDLKLIRSGLMGPVGSNASPTVGGVVSGGAVHDDGGDPSANKFGGGWSGMAFGLNMDLLNRVVHKGRDWKTETDIQLPGTDGIKGQIITDEGLQVLNEKAQAVLTGIAN